MEETNSIHTSLYKTDEMSFFSSFNIDNDDIDLNKIFPFELDEDKYYDVIFPSMHISNDEISPFSDKLTINESNETVFEKLSNFIDNNSILLTNEPATQSQSNIDSNLKLAENTLPGSILSLMKRMNIPLSEEIIYQHIKDKIENFRKANGSKYSDDVRSVLNSTLKSSGIFYKTNEGLFFYKEKESMDFILKNMERELKKKISKEKKEIKSKCSKKSSSSISKKKTNELSFTSQMNYQICKINTILDHMMTRCRNDSKYAKISTMINGSSIEMLKEFCEKDKFIGMMMTIKYFKSLIEKYLKYISKKKNIEHLFDLNKINERILTVCNKIESIEKNFNQYESDFKIDIEK